MTTKGTKNRDTSQQLNKRSSGQPEKRKKRKAPTDCTTTKKKKKSRELEMLEDPYGEKRRKKKLLQKGSSFKEPSRHNDPRRQTNGKENYHPDNTDGNLLNADLVQSPTEPNKDADEYEDDLFNDEEEDTRPSKQVFNDDNLDEDDESGKEEGQQRVNNNNNNDDDDDDDDDDEDDDDDDDDETQDDETQDDDDHPVQTGGNQGKDYGQIRIPDNSKGCAANVSDISTLEKCSTLEKSLLEHLQKNGVVDSTQTVISEVKSVARDKAWKHFKVLNTVDLEYNSPFARFCLSELRLLPPKTDTTTQKRRWAEVKKYLVDGISQARSAATQKIQKNFIGKCGKLQNYSLP